jgi:predicted dehydrogenase
MKIALLGRGHIVKFQIEALCQLQDIALSDAFDINDETAKLLPASTRFHHTLDAIIEDAEADVFMVSTPNVTHFEIASRVIDAGKRVIIEKLICDGSCERGSSTVDISSCGVACIVRP